MIEPKRTAGKTLGAALAAMLVSACAALIGAEDPIHATASTEPGSDGGGDADIVGGEGGDVAGACLEKTPTATASTFVTPGGTNAAGCGPQATPCNSVQSAIDHLAGKGTVYVAGGKYVEQVKVRGDVTISGGWKVVGGAWMRACGDDAARAIIQAPAGMNKTVIADSLGGEASLVELTIRARDDDAAPGESLYGVFAVGNATTKTSLTLNDVVVEMKNGGAGATGKVGDMGGPAPAAGPPPKQACPPSTTQATPGDAKPGAGAPAGRFSATGYEPGVGAVGDVGATGNNGTAGTGSCITTCVAACESQNTCAVMTKGPNACGTGFAGCGGLGGAGGVGGGGGGSTIAVYAWGASVKVLGGTLHGGNGGAGGSGGAGGPGGPGGSGAPGVPASCSTSCGDDPGNPGNCILKGLMTSPAGGKGGIGGMGGKGGFGGGGAGGSSCLIYIGDGATGDVQKTLLQLGQGGAGGQAGGTPGVGRASCP